MHMPHTKERASFSATILSYFLVLLLFMALLMTNFVPAEHNRSSSSKSSKTQPSKRKRIKHSNHDHHHHQKAQVKPPSSWDQIKNLLTCKQIEGSRVHDPSKEPALGSCSSICRFRDVVHGNTRVVHRADNSPESITVGQETRLLGRKPVNGSTSSRSLTSARSNAVGGSASSSSRGMQLRKLSGCYECHTVLDPSRYPSPRTRICVCSECGEVFPTVESMEIHQAVRHAVSELGPDDSGRNIVEIIFKSSWLKKDNPICKIERILKVHNTQRTIQRFEDCRDAVKIRTNATTKKNPRCAADGNELLRFYCTALSCSLGARGTSNLCGAVPACGVCTVIRHGFPGKASDGKGVRTTASSGKAHDCLSGADAGGRRAMLVCRVIAGRVKRTPEDVPPPPEEDGVSCGSYDSVAGYAGIYSNMEDLYVFNPRAILPCFVVIYKALES